MPKFRKKPVVIEAVQYHDTEEGRRTVGAFLPDVSFYQGKAEIVTLEGTMTAIPGDWIIKGIKGEFYPCKAYIFAATYEPVEGH